VPVLPVCLFEPLWVQFSALLPERPRVSPTHPLGRIWHLDGGPRVRRCGVPRGRSASGNVHQSDGATMRRAVGMLSATHPCML
jgi:hypothetical protein